MALTAVTTPPLPLRALERTVRLPGEGHRSAVRRDDQRTRAKLRVQAELEDYEPLCLVRGRAIGHVPPSARDIAGTPMVWPRQVHLPSSLCVLCATCAQRVGGARSLCSAPQFEAGCSFIGTYGIGAGTATGDGVWLKASAENPWHGSARGVIGGSPIRPARLCRTDGRSRPISGLRRVPQDHV